ncbi:unnamed protein product, partial [Heterotrigona itama]
TGLPGCWKLATQLSRVCFRKADRSKFGSVTLNELIFRKQY